MRPHMSTQTVYPAFFPLWQEFQDALACARTQSLRLKQPPRICFVGRFKTGKSRLINALIGADILPYNTDECTAQIIELAYGAEDKATRIVGLDLDSSPEKPIGLAEFQKAVDFTAMSENQRRTAKASAFRRYLPSPRLLSASIVDTPGYDGGNFEARARNDSVRDQAIKQSSLCVLVTDKLDENDPKYMRSVQQQGTEMIIVLNKADQYDAEQRQGIRDQWSDLGRDMGVTFSFYACSALWQRGTEPDREDIERQRRFFDDEDEREWHQWAVFVSRLSRPPSGQRHTALLAAIHRAFGAAVKAHEGYDRTLQAEATFLEQLPRWRELMSSLIGQAVLEMAVTAARSQKPLPWNRLQNFGIGPENVAPESLLPLDELKQLIEPLYLTVLGEVAQLALGEHCAPLYRFVLTEVSTFSALVGESIKLSSDWLLVLKSTLEDVAWYSRPLGPDFAYAEALSELRGRWKVQPTLRSSDCARIRRRLAAALA